MAPEQKTEIVEHLERGRQDFIARSAVLPRRKRRIGRIPRAGRCWIAWNTLPPLKSASWAGWKPKSVETPTIDKEKEAGLMARVPDRSTRVKAPEAVVPTGRFALWRKRWSNSTPDARAVFSLRRSLRRSLSSGRRASALWTLEWRRVHDDYRRARRPARCANPRSARRAGAELALPWIPAANLSAPWPPAWPQRWPPRPGACWAPTTACASA